MYEILVYNGGVYRFDELVEFVEDVGGLVLKRDDFHVSRGAYFMSQEVHVLIVTPEEVIEDLKDMAADLLGDIEILDVEHPDKINVISLIPVYNILSKENDWMSLDAINDRLKCPCIDGICQEFERSSCLTDIEKTLEAMCRMEIAESRQSNGNDEYRLKID
jgi:hypothetical protein